MTDAQQMGFSFSQPDVPERHSLLSRELSVDSKCTFVLLPVVSESENLGIIELLRAVLVAHNIAVETRIHDRGTLGVKELYVFALRPKGVERCRDDLKELFFRRFLESGKTNEEFQLSTYIEFLPPPKKKAAEFVQHTFVHGVGRFYRFLFDEKKLDTSKPRLTYFLRTIPENCPNHLFVSGPKASKGNWTFPCKARRTSLFDLPQLATSASKLSLMKRAHENLEAFLIKNDPSTFACEVPVWLQPSDFPNYEDMFSVSQCITGHIDILRLENDGRIGVWDYKPNAEKETSATQQVWLYMLMLSMRCGLPFDLITGGYFDELNTYQVDRAHD